jgi:sugar-specific transcriptional regulator TrmB
MSDAGKELWGIMDLNTLVEKLRIFGLIENEARVYLALALKGPLRPGEIAGASGVARAEVHRHLHSLEKKGFCVVVGEKGKKYSAINPGEALSSLVEQEEIRRDQMRERKDKLMSDWSSSQRSISSSMVEPERLQVLRDVGIALEKGLNMALSSKDVCRVVLRKQTIEEYFSSEILQVIESHRLMEEVVRKKQVRFNLLLVSSTADIGNLRDVFRKIDPSPNVEVRWGTSPLLEVLPDTVIADDDEMLIHTSPQKKEDKAVETRNPKAVVTNVSAMIGSFIVMFDQQWKNAARFLP